MDLELPACDTSFLGEVLSLGKSLLCADAMCASDRRRAPRPRTVLLLRGLFNEDMTAHVRENAE